MKTVFVIIIGVMVLAGVGLLAMRNKRKNSQDRRADTASQGGTFSITRGEVDGRPLIAMIDTKLRNLPGRQGLPFS
jgi:hypothetical protein